jgi:hypothetical protein
LLILLCERRTAVADNALQSAVDWLVLGPVSVQVARGQATGSLEAIAASPIDRNRK